MRIGHTQQMRTGQQMRMVPRLIQSMEVLQLPAAELQERLAQELEKNVALEAKEPGFELELQRPESERPIAEPDAAAEGFERLRELERSYGEMMDGDGGRSRRGDGERDGKMEAMANTPSRGENLSERLLHDWRTWPRNCARRVPRSSRRWTRTGCSTPRSNRSVRRTAGSGARN